MLLTATILVFTSGCTLLESAPVATFEANPTQGGPAPMSVTFTDKSTGSGITSKVWQYKLNPENPWDSFMSDSYEWTTFSLKSDSSYRFEKAGSYDIKLTVVGKGGSDELIKPRYINIGCDFSIHPGIERCYEGVGSQCSGVSIPYTNVMLLTFIQDEKTCNVEGWASVGSILHDKCCLETKNAGYLCKNNVNTTLCKKEWDEAQNNYLCSKTGLAPRQWEVTFGPYPLGNTGDNTYTDLKVPPGERVKPEYSTMCQSGKCSVQNGAVKNEYDICGDYCTCQ